MVINMNSNPLKRIVELQKAGQAVGIYSCCSANNYVIEAALECAKRDDSCVLIESTANQVDQNGGYTGMKPADFRDFDRSLKRSYLLRRRSSRTVDGSGPQ